MEVGNIYGSVVLCLKAFFAQPFHDVFRAPLNSIFPLQMLLIILCEVRFVRVIFVSNLCIVYFISESINGRV